MTGSTHKRDAHGGSDFGSDSDAHGGTDNGSDSDVYGDSDNGPHNCADRDACRRDTDFRQ